MPSRSQPQLTATGAPGGVAEARTRSVSQLVATRAPIPPQTIPGLPTPFPPFPASATGELTVVVTTTTYPLAVNTRHIIDTGTLCTLTLPGTMLHTDKPISVEGKGAGMWKIALNAGQTIYMGRRATTTGAAGSVAAKHAKDAITLRCITDNTQFEVVAFG